MCQRDKETGVVVAESYICTYIPYQMKQQQNQSMLFHYIIDQSWDKGEDSYFTFFFFEWIFLFYFDMRNMGYLKKQQHILRSEKVEIKFRGSSLKEKPYLKRDLTHKHIYIISVGNKPRDTLHLIVQWVNSKTRVSSKFWCLHFFSFFFFFCPSR